MPNKVNQVTIVIPVYNRERLILRAVQSIQNQTYAEWTLIIVDDCSTDKTVDVIKDLQDPRIVVLSTENNSGAATARNIGIKHATTRFVALLDSDDVMHPECLQESIKRLNANPEHLFSYCGIADISTVNTPGKSDKIWTIPVQYRKKVRPYLYQLNFGTSAGIFFNRSIFEKVGWFDESLQAAEDTDFFIRASQFSLGLPISKTLIFKDDGGVDRLTHDYRKNASAYDVIIQKNMEWIQHDPVLTRKWFYKAMWLNYYAGRKEKAKAYFNKLPKQGFFGFKAKFVSVLGEILSSRNFISLHKAIG